MTTRSAWPALLAALPLTCAVLGCGGAQDARTYTIGGTIEGLTGSGLVLATAGQPDLEVGPGSTRFTFAKSMPAGTAYAVTVAMHPLKPSETCTVQNGTGTVGEAPVSSVAVRCFVDCQSGGSAMATGAQFITYGVADGGGHPYVADLVYRNSPDQPWKTACTGSLVDPRVIITAAHCFEGVSPSDGVERAVTFDPVLGAASELIPYRWVKHPGFTWSTAPLHDSAVLLIDRPVCPARLARLPPLGLLTAMDASGFLVGRRYDAVGYGVIEPADPGQPVLDESTAGTRRVATGTHLWLSDSVLSISQDPTKGDGGTCGHDSGGPNLFAGTDLIAGQTAGGDPNCMLTNETFRVDTGDAQDFLAEFVLIPSTVPVCHVGGATEFVTVDALDEHLQHGDPIGECAP